MTDEDLLVDTGPLIACYNQREPHHASCRQALENTPFGKAYTCWPVITEAAYLLRGLPRQQDDLFQALIEGDLVLLPLQEQDLNGVRQILSRYQDQEIDLADACLLHLAERERIGSLLTLDRRHFRLLRKSNGDYLKLLPEA